MEGEAQTVFGEMSLNFGELSSNFDEMSSNFDDICPKTPRIALLAMEDESLISYGG